MINFSQLNEVQILIFALILLRMSSFVVSAAIFNSPFISVPLKILISLVLTIAIFNPISTNEIIAGIKELENQILLLAAQEVIIGLVLGFMTRLFFFVVAMAGELVSLAMGLGQAQVFNPMMGSMGNAVEQFYSIIATLLFLAFNGHHLMISGLVESFTAVPLTQIGLEFVTFGEVVQRIQSFLALAIKISAPVLISMMVIQLGMALLNRVVPQINVIFTSVSITSLLGFFILFISLPLLAMQLGTSVEFSMSEFFKFLKAI